MVRWVNQSPRAMERLAALLNGEASSCSAFPDHWFTVVEDQNVNPKLKGSQKDLRKIPATARPTEN